MPFGIPALEPSLLVVEPHTDQRCDYCKKDRYQNAHLDLLFDRPMLELSNEARLRNRLLESAITTPARPGGRQGRFELAERAECTGRMWFATPLPLRALPPGPAQYRIESDKVKSVAPRSN